MDLRVYWRGARSRRCMVTLFLAATGLSAMPALAKKEAPASERVSAREAMERQFAAPAQGRPPELSGAEAAAILKKYHVRIGQMIEPKREIGGDRSGR